MFQIEIDYAYIAIRELLGFLKSNLSRLLCFNVTEILGLYTWDSKNYAHGPMLYIRI